MNTTTASGATSRAILARSTPFTSGITTSTRTTSTRPRAMVSTSSASVAPPASNTRYPASLSRRYASRRTIAASSTMSTVCAPGSWGTRGVRSGIRSLGKLRRKMDQWSAAGRSGAVTQVTCESLHSGYCGDSPGP